jgi:hypothetical protein
MGDWIGVGLLLLGALQSFVLLLLLGRVSRLGALLSSVVSGGRGKAEDSASGGSAAGASDAASAGAFAEFLAEDRSREALPKRELFAAYRKWRQQKGLNWTPP